LDIENDRVLKLNSVAAEMWTMLSTGQTQSQIAVALSQKYRVSEERVAADVASLARRIDELGVARDSIFNPAPETDDPSGSPHPSFPWYGQASSYSGPTPTITMRVAAFLGLAVFDLILSLLSLKTLCSCVRLWPVKRSRFTGSWVTGQVCEAVQRACIWYPKRALCLQRSAVTTCLLRTFGISARMMIGVRSMPFLAHAWVEADGSVINDWPRVKKFYSPLLSH